MAKTKKDRDNEILDYKIAEADRLALMYELYHIGQDKIDNQLAIKAKHEAHKAKIK